jgi:hypothetical protein
MATAVCAMGVLAGSRAWLWITRAVLPILALIAAGAVAADSGDYETVILLDNLWVAAPATLRALLGAWAVSLVTLAIFLGRRPRTVRPA